MSEPSWSKRRDGEEEDEAEHKANAVDDVDVCLREEIRVRNQKITAFEYSKKFLLACKLWEMWATRRRSEEIKSLKLVLTISFFSSSSPFGWKKKQRSRDIRSNSNRSWLLPHASQEPSPGTRMKPVCSVCCCCRPVLKSWEHLRLPIWAAQHPIACVLFLSMRYRPPPLWSLGP